jgi:protein-S-isoprenylcysteine O-methyltransferase Ste14
VSGRAGSPPLAALIGTVVFVALVPGTVVVLVPYMITEWDLAPAFAGTGLTRVLGVLLMLAAVPVFFAFVARFVVEGHGTPAPIAPPERLVVGGPFRYTRNPGYVAVVALVVGQGLLFASPELLLYAVALALCFHVFVLAYEEPTLRDTYGPEFDDYCRRVPRWIPRRPRV